MNPAVVQTQWARLLMDSLAHAGIETVIVSPGSRSTPLTFAVLQNSNLDVRIVLDERCAAFFALGAAKVSAKPVALICTSGSALTHYLPALVEADSSHVPLIVLSADRPPELQHCSAPQTMQQCGVFGSFARLTLDVGPPNSSLDALRSLQRNVRLAAMTALGPVPGPVHVNIPLRKPLEPAAARTTLESEVEQRVGALLASLPSPSAPPQRQARFASSAIEAACNATSGFLALGAASCQLPEVQREVSLLARQLGFPVLCEAASGTRFADELDPSVRCDAVDFVLDACAPPPGSHYILQFGPPLVSAAYSRWLSRVDDLELHVVSNGGFPDPSGRARSVLDADPLYALRQFRTASASLALHHESIQRWQARIHELDSRWWQSVELTARNDTASDAPLSELVAIRELVHSLPPESALVLGNSLPIREIDWFVPAGSAKLRVYCQRGMNGIDGGISSACGIAHASRRPTILVVGDLSFLHDVGGLLVASSLNTQLVIVVLNNAGGRLFEQLPVATSAIANADFERAWIVPHQVEIAAVATAYGLAYHRIEKAGELPIALGQALQNRAHTVIEARIAPGSARIALESIRAATAGVSSGEH